MHFSTLAVYDAVTETWSTPATRGDICRERAFHASLLWGRNLIIGLGTDGKNEMPTCNMLNVDTLYWEAWDGNIARSGPAMGLLEGKLIAVGGGEGGGADKKKDVHQFNLGGYMLNFDGVDDEIMIPHLPTIITSQYSIEAGEAGQGRPNEHCDALRRDVPDGRVVAPAAYQRRGQV